MHFLQLGEADCLPRQPLDPRLQGQVLPLDLLGVPFSNHMPVGGGAGVARRHPDRRCKTGLSQTAPTAPTILGKPRLCGRRTHRRGRFPWRGQSRAKAIAGSPCCRHSSTSRPVLHSLIISSRAALTNSRTRSPASRFRTG